MPALEIHLFGSFEVVGPTGHLTVGDFPSRKSKQVGEVLALARGRPVSKERLVDLLWSDRVPRDPNATVEHAVSLLRATLGTVIDSPTIVTERGRYRFDQQQIEIDLVRFDELVHDAERSLGLDRLGALQKADALATGDVLEDEPTAAWAEVERDRYRRCLERAALGIAQLALAHDDAEVAHEAAERARLASDPVLEEAYALDISALVRLGRRHEARSLMRELERRLADEEASEPSAQTAALRVLLRPTQRRVSAGVTRPIMTMLDFSASDLPADELPFIGRHDAVATIEGAIKRASGGDNELVMVEGVPGIGKSRLLTEIAERRRNLSTDHHTHQFACQPSDHGHPMLAVGRLLRGLARAARMRSTPTIDLEVAPMFGRLADVLDRVGPTVLLIDDLHLADPASLDVLGSLVAPGAVQSLCVVGARRPLAPGADVQPDGSSIRIVHLRSLTEDDIQVLGQTGAWTETGGHPASLAACLRASRQGGVLDPDDVAHLLALVEDCGELTRVVLGVAATLDQPMEITELARRSRLARETTADLIERAVGLGLVRTDTGQVVSFAGDLTRRVLRAAATPH
jgi:DNA-binding SARP family transcriptional activator